MRAPDVSMSTVVKFSNMGTPSCRLRPMLDRVAARRGG
jgi:hypothetical protein